MNVVQKRDCHGPPQRSSAGTLKILIREAAEKIVQNKGLEGLTVRSLALAVGYAPGTIYNFYRDMDALAIEVNYATLGRMGAFCEERMADRPTDFSQVRALAYAYVDFAKANRALWQMLFAARPAGKTAKLPRAYQERMAGMFELIEATLAACLAMPRNEAAAAARLLWACLHGITVLALDGRLQLAGVTTPRTLIDDLLKNYLKQ